MIVDSAIYVDGRRTAEALTRQKFRETNLLERTRVEDAVYAHQRPKLER